MSAPDRIGEILAPVVTPFHADLSPDAGRLLTHCRWLLSQGLGLVPFGTTGEANSLSADERMGLLDVLIDAGIDPLRTMPGTGCCALSDTITLTRHALRSGCRRVLMLPPFYYKDVGDDGLFRSYAEVIERIGSDDLRIYLYHIPPVAQLGISAELVERLVKTYPNVIAGIKDSAGDWDYSLSLLQRGWDNFRVFSGNESFLLRNLAAGGAGCISATANINPGAMVRLCREWRTANASTLQQGLDQVREILQQQAMIPALKATLAHFTGEPGWERLRPPLMALPKTQKETLLATLRQCRFEMPGMAGPEKG